MEKTINEDWLQQRQQNLKKEREKNSKYLALKNGENTVKLDVSVMPVEDPNGKFGKRMIYTTEIVRNIDGKDVKLLLSTSPALETLILKALATGINPFTLIKIGEGRNTRYAIKELEED